MLDSMAHMPFGAARWLHAADNARLDEPGATDNAFSAIMSYHPVVAIAKHKADDDNHLSPTIA